MDNSEYQIQRIQIPNYPNPKCQFKLENRIQFIFCLLVLSRCSITDFLFVKVSIACNDSKTNSHTQASMQKAKMYCTAINSFSDCAFAIANW